MPDDFPLHDRSFVARYGATILRGGIAAIPAALYRYQAELGLGPQLVWFISAILAHKWDAHMPSPSLKKMADETGVSRQQLHNYERQLVQAGWLRVINRLAPDGGTATNLYDFSVAFQKLEELLERDRGTAGDGYIAVEARGGVNPSLQGGVKSDFQGPVNRSLQGGVNHGGHMKNQFMQKQLIEKDISKDPLVGEKATGQRDHVPATRRGASSTQGLQDHATQASDSDPEFHSPPRRAPRGRPPKPSPYIERVVTDVSAQLHDKDHAKANVTQATRLFRASGLSEQEFVEQIYAARDITRSRGDIRKAVGGDQASRNRAPYFFRVLEDVVSQSAPAAQGRAKETRDTASRHASAAGGLYDTQDMMQPAASLEGAYQEDVQCGRPELTGEHDASLELHRLWQATLDDLREQVVPANYQRWLERTSLLSREAGVAVVSVPDQISADQLARRLDPLIRHALADTLGEEVTVRYEVLEQ